MYLITSTREIKALPRGHRRVGLVPTMGYLHDGHASLIRRARAENDLVVVSVFVNPMQFGPSEDLARYPRDLERDTRIAEAAGAEVLFVPDATEMYPAGFASRLEVAGPALPLEGARRPGHFAGVATVVAKLFHLVRPNRAYFGEKDWQQLQVVRRLVEDLNFDLEVVGCPTQREASGLALSSRNTYLTEEQRQEASVLYRSLRAAQAAYRSGERQPQAIVAAGKALLAAAPLELEYLQLVGPDLEDLEQTGELGDPRQARLLLAARMFGVRLIDNAPLVQEEAT
ncbi:pantoate--beta-alanine ligase [Deinobacterium chartae]|uniref:Pantothenate synthetase n=1 Tax=Deinobacterium chartae TaxID=521158 RepID=A0A841HXV0_9DEIO|nr:pantoate--beta-alanine ligase [Deinobacterium chartae]MBB6097030.1 pantoate--beta-alanine ligase [Deinobacterium chartae]